MNEEENLIKITSINTIYFQTDLFKTPQTL